MYRKRLPHRRMFSNNETVWVGGEIDIGDLFGIHLSFRGEKPRPGSGENLREIDTYLLYTRTAGTGSGEIRTRKLLVMCAPAG